jgi:hypothetical protein
VTYFRMTTAFVLALLLAAAVVSLPIQSLLADSQRSLAEIIQLTDDERKSVYLNITFQTDGWKTGKVISRMPYSVIINEERQSAEIVYELQIWRGVAVRVEDDLLTRWDLLGLNAEGKVIQVSEDYRRALPGYFKAPSHNQFQTIQDINRYPWVNLPTDREARAAQIPPIPKDGSLDVYGILPREDSVVISALSDKVKPLLAIPAQIAGNQPLQPELHPDKDTDMDKGMSMSPTIPADLTFHWAKNFIIDLMSQSILTGYSDQTIRPNGVLTKAEFITMFVRALRLELIDGTAAAGFVDMEGHWAEHEVDTALESGLVKAEPALFHPDSPISRLETVRMLGRAFQALPSAYKQELVPAKIVLNDLQSVSPEDAEIIALLTSEGIIAGDPDGKFRPADSLTRAEASKMLSLFLYLK